MSRLRQRRAEDELVKPAPLRSNMNPVLVELFLEIRVELFVTKLTNSLGLRRYVPDRTISVGDDIKLSKLRESRS